MAKQKEAWHAKKRQARSDTVIEHLKTLVEAQRKMKAGPSALHPVMKVSTPMQETKGKVRKRNILVRLLQLLVLAVMSQPFGAQLVSWTTGVAVDCGAEWSREAVDIAVAEDFDYQVKAGFTVRSSVGTRSRTTCPRTLKSLVPLPSSPKLDAEVESFSIYPSQCVGPLRKARIAAWAK